MGNIDIIDIDDFAKEIFKVISNFKNMVLTEEQKKKWLALVLKIIDIFDSEYEFSEDQKKEIFNFFGIKTIHVLAEEADAQETE